MKISTKKMVRMAILAAMSIFLVMNIHFPIIPAAPYLEYDPADIPILIGTFMYGPVTGILITLVVSLIQAMTVSAASGWVGAVMHVIATGTFVLVAGTIYQRKRNFLGAVIALIFGSISMALIMIPANLFFTVRFWGTPYDAVKGMILPILIPFNLVKAGINSVVTVTVYKAIANTLRKSSKKSVSETKIV
ncbi:MAG: ECF transporter S component [Halanaerobiales bacterium]|nr:ECF transporter S component [Halanaerobiales bacterium]